ncbi:MAG: DUF4175 family protein [Bacteroidota bacterium]
MYDTFGQKPVEQKLRYKLNELRRKENAIRQAEGILRFVLIIVGAWLLLVLVESFVHTPPIVRTMIMLLFTGGMLGAFGRYFIDPLLRRMGIMKSNDDLTLAEKVGKKYPQIKDHFRNALEILEEQRQHTARYSSLLIDAVLNDLERELQAVDISRVMDYSIPFRLMKYATGVVVVFVLFCLILPVTLRDTSYRLLHFSESFAAPLPFAFEILPGNKEIVKGEAVDIVVRLRGEQQKDLELYTRTEGQTLLERIALHRDSSGKFLWHSPILKNSFEYYAQKDEIKSDIYTITVVDRPVIKALRVRLHPPAYTGIPDQILDDNIGDISALCGTRATLNLSANKEIARAFIAFSDYTRHELFPQGTDVTGSFTIKKDLRYHCELQDEKGIVNIDPISYSIRSMPDEPPTVAITVPGRNIDLNDNMQVALLMNIHDDYGFSRLQVRYRLSQSKYEKPEETFSTIDIPLPAKRGKEKGIDLAVPFLWDLSSLRLASEDVVTYYAEVYDNDAIGGPKIARTREYTLRYPSLDEIFSDADKQHSESLEDLQENLKQAEELRKNLNDITQQMRKNQQLDWQQQKKLEETLKRYEELRKNIQNTSQRLDTLFQGMQNKNILSQETLEKYLELQQLLQQIDSPELNAALRRMQEAMKQLSPDQIRQAMEQLTFSEENFRQSIERTMSLLKRIQIEQKFDEAIRRTAELEQRQAEMKNQSAKTPPGDTEALQQLAEKQKGAEEDYKKLQQQLSDLQKRMEEFPDEMPLREYAQATEFIEQQKVDVAMEAARQQLQQAEPRQAREQQQRAQSALSEFGKQMQHTKDIMQQRRQQQLLAEFQKMMQELLEMSAKEEDLKNESRALDPSSQRFRENAQSQQQIVEDLGKLANTLGQMSQKTFAVTPKMGKAIGEAFGKMTGAIQSLEERNGQEAADRQHDAMAALNDATRQIQQAMDNAMQGGEGGLSSLLQQLGRMAAQQQGINLQTQDLSSQGGLTSEQAAQAARLAAEQATVQKSLEQLSNEARQSSEQQKLLGDLDKIAEEMKEVVRDLEQHDINPATLQRQEKILSRLLDAQRSMRERDYEKRRRAETGKEYQQISPSELDQSTVAGTSRLMQDLRKALEQGYTKEYQELIKRYFEELQKIQ